MAFERVKHTENRGLRHGHVQSVHTSQVTGIWSYNSTSTNYIAKI